MDKLEYNCDLLRTTRESKKITAQSIAFDLCLSERHIISIEENSLQYFPSNSLKYVSLKKYILALGLNLEDVIHNFNEVDPIPSLLKKK
jgi:cytoskeletal protein RodZ